MLNQKHLYHAASALADSIADSCRDGAIDLALEQADALKALVVEHQYSPPPSIPKALRIEGEAA